MIQKPTKEQLNAIDLTELFKHIRSRGVDFFCADAGVEHYRLLAWFSTQFNNTHLLEVGTLDGCGALALSYNPNNKVSTYDIRFYDDYIDQPPNLKRKLVTDFNYLPDIMRSPFIHYDAMHDGTQEREFLDMLISKGWKGIVMWDDIYFSEPMTKFWNSITQRKEDFTAIGHRTGSGICWIE